jgi:hypothetical protein
MLARYLLAAPPAQSEGWSDEELSQTTADAWGNLIRDLYNLDFCSGDPEVVEFDAEAREKIKTFINENKQKINESPDPNVKQMRSKMDGYVLKFALVIHLVEQMSNPDSIKSNIDGPTVDRAVGLANWFIHEATRIYRGKGATLSSADGERRDVLQFIRSHGGAVTKRELMMQFRRRFFTAQQAEDYLEGLAERGDGSWKAKAAGRHGGRPAKRFVLNPEAAESA